MTDNMPMPPERFQELMQARQLAPAPDLLVPVDPREPAVASSPLAVELLAETDARPLESGELLLICEETSLPDLESAVAGQAVAEAPTMPTDEPALAALATPRLFAPRLDAIMGWEPPLAEVLRLLEAALQAGANVHLTMLVGHVEHFPEWVEHLMRLRHLRDEGRGTLTVAVALADPAALPAADPRVREIAAAARPADPEVMRRHAVALARLALGAGTVVG